jgi:predicted nuclease with TOPRIM domain
MQSHRQKHLMRFLIERAELIQEIVPLEDQLENYCGEISGLEKRWEELIEQSQQDFQLNDVQPGSLRQLRQRCQLTL